LTVHANDEVIRGVPFNQLFLSEDNVRKEDSNLGIPQLAALIKAEGVIQNLVGYEETEGRGKKKVIKIGVVAGGRRYRAIALLVEQQLVPETYIVPCLVTSRAHAVAKSLMENSGRQDLHPADEYVAFRKLVLQGRSIEEVAAAFHVEPLFVQRQLRLANVHPDFLEMYRKDVITLDDMMALAVTEDTQKQHDAWHALPEQERIPYRIRQLLTQTKMAANMPIARFVGLEAYQAAGGALDRDLFLEGDRSIFLLDIPLVHRLAQEKLAAVAESLKPEAGAWIEANPRMELADLAAYEEVDTVRREPTAQESATLEAIRLERDALESELQDMDVDDERYSETDERVTELQSQEEELLEEMEVPDPQQQAHAGTIVYLDSKGEVKVRRGLLKPEDARLLAQQHQRLNEGTEGQSQQDETRKTSAAMVLRLSAHRTAALQATLIDNTKIAVVALCHRLVLAAFFEQSSLPAASLRIQVEEPSLDPHAEDLKTSKAYLAVQNRRAQWRERIPKVSADVLPWLLEQSEPTVLELLGFCTSLSIDALTAREGGNQADALARACALDMNQWWTATAEGYLNKIRKDDILEIVRFAVSPDKATALKDMKKKDLALAAEEALQGSPWLPEYLARDRAA